MTHIIWSSGYLYKMLRTRMTTLAGLSGGGGGGGGGGGVGGGTSFDFFFSKKLF